MNGINKVILVGTLGADPEVRYAANGNAVASLSVATSEKWTDKNTGEKHEKTEWHKVSIFGKLAEVAGQYLKKGSQAYFEGKLSTKKWQDKNGQDRYTTEVVLSGFDGTMQMLGGGGDRASGQSSNSANNQQQQQQPQGGQRQYQQPAQSQAHVGQQASQRAPQQQAPAYAPNDFGNDDVPF